jgi:hypothetical protein
MRTSVKSACLLASALVAACGDGGGSTNPTCNTCPCSAGSSTTQIETPTGCSPGTPKSSTFDPPSGTNAAAARHLGEFQVGETVRFDVPDGTASITIVEQAVSAPAPPIAITLSQSSCTAPFLLDNVAVPLQVKDPSGTVVYDDRPTTPANGEEHAAFFASDSPFTGTFTIPNTSAALDGVKAEKKVGAGTWSFTVSDFGYECTLPQEPGTTCTGGSASSRYDVTVITKQATAGVGIPPRGTLDVVFYLVTHRSGSGQELNANLDADLDLLRVRSALATLFRQANIELGSVRFKALPDAIAKYGDVGLDVDEQGGCAEVPQLLANAEPGNALNIFLVSSLHSGETKKGNEVVGIDGTIPGPASIGGTVASGAAVSVEDLGARPSGVSPGSPGDPCSSTQLDLNCGDDRVAYIIAHEAGHFLGLYHTTESLGTSYDPLRDTAQCPCQSCAPRSQRSQCADSKTRTGSPYRMTVSDCSVSTSCGGGDDLMFWLFGRGSQGNLTAEQTQVMRANPLVH